MKPSLVIRADAGTLHGTGHLVRCLALAQRWHSQGGHVHIVSACESEELCQSIAREGFRFTPVHHPFPDSADWDLLAPVLRDHEETWVVLDGYHFNSVFQSRIKKTGCRLLVIDDLATLPHHYADVLLNQNIHAPDLHYHCEPYTQLLLGNRYALLRSDFLTWRDWQRDIPPVAHKLLVTLGGSDPQNQTAKVIGALNHLAMKGLETLVIVGPANDRVDSLQSVVRTSGVSARLVTSPPSMAELMAWADVAISAAGSTCWELAFMGVPSLMLVLADNQQPIAERNSEAEAGVNLGWSHGVTERQIAHSLSTLIHDRSRRERMSRKGRDLIDGWGSHRVISVLGVKAESARASFQH